MSKFASAKKVVPSCIRSPSNRLLPRPGNDDEYEAEGVVINTAGTYIWGVRFSRNCATGWTYGDKDGSLNGFQLDQAGRIVVSD